MVFWSFRIMVGLGLLMIALGWWGAVLWRLGKLETTALFLRAATWMGPAGFLAVLAGWMVTEIGRQPYVIYGVLRTVDAVSPVPAAHVGFSLLAYMSVYALVFAAGVLLILRLLVKGPDPGGREEPPRPTEAPGSALGAAPEAHGEAP
jgi:cytochrome d ubiquinol oxidase subunit I